MGVGARDALVESSGLVLKNAEKAVGGKALTELAAQQGKISAAKAFGIKLAGEAGTEAVMAGGSITAQIAHDAILHPEGAKANMLNPQYWASTIASEGVMSVLGVTMGNIKNGVHLNDVAQLDDAGKPIFQKSAEPAADLNVPADEKATTAMTATGEVTKSLLAKTGEEATAPLADNSASSVQTVASALQATGKLGVNTNAAQAAASLLAKGDSSLVESLLKESVVTNRVDQPTFSLPVSNFLHELIHPVGSALNIGEPKLRLGCLSRCKDP